MKLNFQKIKKFSAIFFVMGILVFGFNTIKAEAATTGEVYPTLGETVSETPWSDNTWVTPENIYSDDAATANVIHSTYDSPDQTYVLKATGFDFSSIPDGSTINGVTVRMNAFYRSGQGSGSMDLCQLLDVSKAKVGTNNCSTAVPLTTTTSTIITKGSGSDNWGNSLTTAWVKNANFGVAIGILATAANADVDVDYVTIEINYTPLITTTLSTGTNPTGSTIAPGAGATYINQFILTTSEGTDAITAVTVSLPTTTGIGTVAIHSNSSCTASLGSVGGGTGSGITSSTNISITSTNATTGGTTFYVCVTPLSHASMPAVPGGSYSITGSATDWTGTNTKAGTGNDTSNTFTIDNTSPAAVTSSTATIGVASAVDLAWTNPADSDFTTSGTVVVLRRASNAITQVPAEGTTYIVGNTIGGVDIVACVVTGSPPATSCQDTGLDAGTPYHYKIFTQDSRGNYNAGTVPTGSPATPVSAKHVTGTSNSTGTVKVAVNGTLNGASTTISGGNFDITLTGVQPVIDDVITVFIQSASQTDESTAVTRYDGSGDITGVILNQNVLSIGSVDDQILSVSDLGLYDCDQSEDIMHSANSGTLLLDGCSNGYTNPTMQVESGDTFKSAGVEVVTARNITNNGTVSETTWRYSRAITIDYTKVPNSAQTNFPVLVKGTYSYLATTGNGGKVNHASGYDIAFFSDASLTRPLKFEREKWVATTGEIVAWVKIPSLSNTVNTVIYVAYGNTSISSDQADPTNVWDSNYLSVYHLGDGTSIDLNDSTSNNNDLVNGNSTPATAGPINGGANFVRANSNYMYGGTTISNDLQTTRSAWVNVSSIPTAGYFRNILGSSNGIDAGYLDHTLEYNSDQKAYFYTYCGGANFTSAGSNTIATSTWVYLTTTHDYEGISKKLYLNGQLEGSSANRSCINNYSSPNLYISGRGTATGASNYGDFFDGKVAEVRFSKTVRSADWIATEYNNQNSPSTFYSVGSEVILAPTFNITKDLTASAGTISGAYPTVTVNGDIKCGATCGTVSYTGGLVEQKVAANQNFGTSVSADSTAWTFANLKFSNSTGTSKTVTVPTVATGNITVTGTLSIGGSGDTGATVLDAGNRTWNLSSNGTPLSILSSPQGVLTASTSTFNFNPASSSTVTVAAATYNNLVFNSASTTFSLAGTTDANGTLTLTAGTLDANNNNISTTNFSSSNSNTRAITMGTGTTWTLTGTGTVWDTTTSTGLTVTQGTSTIKLTNNSASLKTFSGGGKTYNNIWFAPASGAGTFEIRGANTFNDFKDDGTAAHSILFTAGTTTTVTTFTVSGTAGNLITINSGNGSGGTSTATHSLVKAGGGTINRDYLNIQHSVATPSDTWYTNGANSVNNQAVVDAGSGWIFVTPFTISGTSSGLANGTVVRVAINGVLDTNSTTTVTSNAWSFDPGSSDPTINQPVVVWADGGADDTVEATAVSKYDGSGDMSGMVLNVGTLSIGSANSVGVTLDDLDSYTCSNDEDVMYSAATGGTLNTQGCTNSYTGDTLSVLASNTLTVGTTETVTTEKINNAGTITSTGNSIYNLTGISSDTLFTNTGTFTEATSTVNVTSASGTPTLLSAAETFHILNINSTATVVNAGAAITIADASGSKLYVQAGVLNDSGLGVSTSGSTNNTLQLGSTGTLCLGGAAGANTSATCDTSATSTTARAMPAFATYTFDSASTVVYLSDAATTISNTPVYGNLYLKPKLVTTTRTYTLGGAMTINGDFTINPDESGASTPTFNIDSGGAIAVASGKTTTISRTNSALSNLNTTGTNYAFSTGYLNIATGGTFTPNSSLVTLNGTSGTLFTKVGTLSTVGATSQWDVTSASGTPTLFSASTTLHILKINSSATVINLGASLTTDNNSGNKLWIASGVLNMEGQSIGPGTSGTLQVDSGATFCLGGTTGATNATCDSGATQTSVSTFPNFTTKTLNSNSTVAFLADAAQTVPNYAYGNLRLSPKMTVSRTYTLPSGLSITGNLDIKPSASAGSLAFLANIPSSGITIAGTTTIQPDATNSPTAKLDSTASNYNLTTGKLDIQTNGTLDIRNSTLNLTGTSSTVFTRVGTFTIGGTSLTKFTGDPASGSVTLTSNNSFTFDNLEISPALTGTGTYVFGTSALTINRDFLIAPTASAVSKSLTVNMGADITLASTGATTISPYHLNSPTAKLDATASNHNLSTGKLVIGTNGTFDVRNSTLTLTNTGPEGLTDRFGLYGSANEQLINPNSVDVDSSGNIYVANTYGGVGAKVKKFNSSGAYVAKWDEEISGFPAGSVQGIAVDSSANVYVSDSTNNTVTKFNSSGVQLLTFSGYTFNGPIGVSVSPQTGYIYVADSGNDKIAYFNSSGSYLGEFGSSGAGNGTFGSIQDIDVAPNGDIYVADYSNSLVQRFNSAATFQNQWSHSLPTAVEADNFGNVYVVSSAGKKISKYTSSGTLVHDFANELLGGGSQGMAIDSSDNLFVANSGNSTTSINQYGVLKFNRANIVKSGTLTLGGSSTANISTVTNVPMNIGSVTLDNVGLTGNGDVSIDVSGLTMGSLTVNSTGIKTLGNDTGKFVALSQTSRSWSGIAIDSSNQNVYATVSSGDIYKQTAGSGNFTALVQTSRGWTGITIDSSNQNVYAAVSTGDIYKQTAGAGNFIALSQTPRQWTGITVDSSNQNVYATVVGGDIYKQTGGTGNFIALGQTSRNWQQIAVDSVTHDVYAVVSNGDIYKQTAGAGNFIALSQTSRDWSGISIDSSNHNVYATVRSGTDSGIYKQTGGTGNFVALNQMTADWRAVSVDRSNHNIYSGVYSGDIYKQTGVSNNLTTSGAVTVTQGTLDTAGGNITASSFSSSNSNTRGINLGSGTLSLTGTGTVWDMTTSTNATITPGTSTIKLTDTSSTGKTFAGGGKTYNNLWFAGGSGGGNYTISGNNTFNTLRDDSTDADAAHSIQFTAGSTQTISDFDVAGTSGNLITLTSTTTSSFNLIKTSLVDVLSDYLSIQYSSVSPYGEWLAGTNSTNLGSNTGWIFNTRSGSRGGGGGNAGGESSGGGTPATGGTGTGGGGGGAGGESSGGGTPNSGGSGTCSDGIQNGNETGIDTGGRCSTSGGGGDVGLVPSRDRLLASSEAVGTRIFAFFRRVFGFL